MNPYLFVVNAIPTLDNRELSDIAGAKVHVWVFAESIKAAEIRALTYITDHHWEPKEIEHAFEIQSEQIPKLHEAEHLLYQKTLQFGISADFLAYRSVPGNPDDPVITRKLRR